jgi:hypothetical protein
MLRRAERGAGTDRPKAGALSPGRALPRTSSLVAAVRQDLQVDRAQEAVDAPFEGSLRRGGAIEVSGGDGAVAEHDEMPRRVTRVPVTGVGKRAPHPLEVPAAVVGDDAADGALRVLELRGGVDEGTAAIPLVPELGDDLGAKLGYEVTPLRAFGDGCRPLDEDVVNALQVTDDEVLLARKVAVEGRQRHVAGGDDPIYADAVNPLGIEEI